MKSWLGLILIMLGSGSASAAIDPIDYGMPIVSCEMKYQLPYGNAWVFVTAYDKDGNKQPGVTILSNVAPSGSGPIVTDADGKARFCTSALTVVGRDVPWALKGIDVWPTGRVDLRATTSLFTTNGSYVEQEMGSAQIVGSCPKGHDNYWGEGGCTANCWNAGGNFGAAGTGASFSNLRGGGFEVDADGFNIKPLSFTKPFGTGNSSSIGSSWWMNTTPGVSKAGSVKVSTTLKPAKLYVWVPGDIAKQAPPPTKMLSSIACSGSGSVLAFATSRDGGSVEAQLYVHLSIPSQVAKYNKVASHYNVNDSSSGDSKVNKLWTSIKTSDGLKPFKQEVSGQTIEVSTLASVDGSSNWSLHDWARTAAHFSGAVYPSVGLQMAGCRENDL